MEFVHYLDGTLGLVEGLVNSHLPDDVHIDLKSPADLERFLKAHGVRPARGLTKRDLEDIKALGAKLRELFDATDPDDAAGILNSLLDQGGARPKLVQTGAGEWGLEYVPPRSDLGRRLGVEAAMALAHVVSRDGFDRLRVCEWDTCRDVFIDRSKNHSRRFCSPDVCGNRASVAAWRARQTSGSRSARRSR